LASIFLERSQPGYALAQYAKALSLANRTPSPQAATPGETGGGEIKGIKGTLVIADPYAAAACAGMGDAYLALGEMPAAIEYYQKAASENAFDAAVHFRLARAYEVVGNFEKALAGYDRALRLNKSMADAKASRKIALMKSEVYEQAKRVYLTSHLSGQEGSADAYYGEGVMLRLSGRRIAAEALFRKAAGQAPMHFGANLALGQILSEKGMHEEAFANFSAAFASQPTSAVAARELALTSLILKDTAGAVQWAAKSYELAPETYYEQFRDDVIRLAEPAQ
jgi:tetratricopeptide (TPR) repeat protein